MLDFFDAIREVIGPKKKTGPDAVIKAMEKQLDSLEQKEHPIKTEEELNEELTQALGEGSSTDYWHYSGDY